MPPTTDARVTPDVDPKWFFDEVITPVCIALRLTDPAMPRLLLGTALVESGLVFERQLGGPAAGYFQMEPFTHNDLWKNWIGPNPTKTYASALRDMIRGRAPDWRWLVVCAPYAAGMAAMHYARFTTRRPLPAATDLVGLGQYWKTFYNTPLGKGTPDMFVAAWKRLGGDAAVDFQPVTSIH